MLNPVSIKGTTISDAWHQCIFEILDKGKAFKIDRGSFEGDYRLEFDFITIQITHPEERPLEPKLPASLGIPDPVPPGYILGDDPCFNGEAYVNYIMGNNVKDGELYSYGQRISGYEYYEPEKNAIDCNINNNGTIIAKKKIINQIEYIIDCYKKFGYRNNQLVLQIANPQDLLLEDPPCCRMIDTRIQDGKLHFYPIFRSWDLWGGMPANLGGFQILKEYMAAEIGVDPGETIAASKGLHLYKYVWELAELRRQTTGKVSKILETISEGK